MNAVVMFTVNFKEKRLKMEVLLALFFGVCIGIFAESFINKKKAIQIRFAADEDERDLRFVEVENLSGYSVNVGEWSNDGKYKLLTIK